VGVKRLLDALKVRTPGRRDRLCLAIKILVELLLNFLLKSLTDNLDTRNEKDMRHTLTGLKIMGLFVLLVTGFCSCASTEAQKSSAEKEREASYSNYVDKIDKEWSKHL
jgi:hypothetical protein